DGRLLVSGNTTGANDKVLQFDAATGAYLGVFAQGNGLSTPMGLALGPDGNLSVTSFGTNFIKRFNGTTGAFIDTFATTANATPTFITFTPFPVPEPSSLLCGGLAAAGLAVVRWRRARGRS